MRLIQRLHGILRTLAASPHGLSISELSETVELPPATVSRMLAVLQELHYVSRSVETQRCHLGPAALHIGLGVQQSRLPANSRAHDMVRDLAAELGTGALLAEWLRTSAYCTFAAGPTLDDGRPAVEAGDKLPVHASAAARALLTGLDAVHVVRLMAEYEFTVPRPQALRSVEAVLQSLADIRLRGYGVAYDERRSGLWEMAAPVRNGASRVVGALGVVMPGWRPEPHRADQVRVRLLAATRELALELGHAGVSPAVDPP